MEDNKIIDLYWQRKEEAIRQTDQKYGTFCFRIANNILQSHRDSEECVSDTYWGLWRAIPPHRPDPFPPFIGKITRNLALKLLEYASASKRNPEFLCSLEELGDCVSGNLSVEDEIENRRIEQAISSFLRLQSPEKRNLFLMRYWYFEPITQICRVTGYSQSKVKSALFQLRKQLHSYLEKEGIDL